MRTPALDAWRRELARGERTPATYDWLWRAACWETSALVACRAAVRDAGRGDLKKARDIVRAAQDHAA